MKTIANSVIISKDTAVNGVDYYTLVGLKGALMGYDQIYIKSLPIDEFLAEFREKLEAK